MTFPEILEVSEVLEFTVPFFVSSSWGMKSRMAKNDATNRRRLRVGKDIRRSVTAVLGCPWDRLVRTCEAPQKTIG